MGNSTTLDHIYVFLEPKCDPAQQILTHFLGPYTAHYIGRSSSGGGGSGQASSSSSSGQGQGANAEDQVYEAFFNKFDSLLRFDGRSGLGGSGGEGGNDGDGDGDGDGRRIAAARGYFPGGVLRRKNVLLDNIVREKAQECTLMTPRTLKMTFRRCKEARDCYRCWTEKRRWFNIPCCHEVWCVGCKDWAIDTIATTGEEHLCIICDRPVFIVAEMGRNQIEQQGWQGVARRMMDEGGADEPPEKTSRQ